MERLREIEAEVEREVEVERVNERLRYRGRRQSGKVEFNQITRKYFHKRIQFL